MSEIVFDTDENIVGRGENAGYQHFLTMFSQVLSIKFIKRQDYEVKV